jgi:RecA/RadA recombinase
MTMQKNNGTGFFSTMFQAMVVFSVMANGTAAVDRTQDDNKKTSQKYESERQREMSELLQKWEKSGKSTDDPELQKEVSELFQKWKDTDEKKLKKISDNMTRIDRALALLRVDLLQDEPANSDDENL